MPKKRKPIWYKGQYLKKRAIQKHAWECQEDNEIANTSTCQEDNETANASTCQEGNETADASTCTVVGLEDIKQESDILDLHTTLDMVAERLKLALSDDKWSVLIRHNCVCLYLLSNEINAKVEKTIAVTLSGKVDFFIGGRNLPPTHSLAGMVVDFEGGEDVAYEVLRTIAINLEPLAVCGGASEPTYQYLWNKGIFSRRGFVETDGSSTFYRSNDCTYLLEYDCEMRCKFCQHLQNDLVRQYRREKKRAEDAHRDKSRVNLKYLTKQDLEEELRSARKEMTKFRRVIRGLKSKLNGLIQKKGKDLSSEINDFIQKEGDDLSSAESGMKESSTSKQR